MKKPTKAQKVIIDWLTEQGGQGHVVTGYRYTRQGKFRGTDTPVLCTFAQAVIGMIDHKMVERVGESRTLFRLILPPDPQLPVGPLAGT